MARIRLPRGNDYMMKDAELLVKVQAADVNALSFMDEIKTTNDQAMSFYECAPWNEIEGHSTVVSSDVQDVVEADMPSHIRTFLGSDDILVFEPSSRSNKADVTEADEKTAMVNWVIRNQKGSFKLIHDFIKTAEIKKFSVLRYDWTEEKNVLVRSYAGLSESEAVNIKLTMLEEDQRKDTDIDLDEESTDDDGINLEFKIKTTKKYIKITPIPTDNFVISRNARDKEDAEIIGDDTLISRGDLVAAGFDKNLVKNLNSNGGQTKYTNGQRQTEHADVDDKASDLILVSTRCIRIDKDGDGIAERRKVIYSGSTLLSDEPFDHVNYAMLSTILMPNESIGKSRAEINIKAQEVKTALVRGMLDNTYRVNSGRVVVNTTNTNIDDVLTQRANGIIRTKGDVRLAVAALETPYVADKTLQVIQYMDFARAQRSGTLMASQGLNADSVSNETATRTNAVQGEGAAKVELVIRVIAETGMKELYEGIAWTLMHYQDAKTELNVLGKEMTINPAMWRHDHSTTSSVGLGASDDDNLINNLSGLLTIHQQLKAQGSQLTDDKKIFNILSKLTRAMGQRDVSIFFNDPDIPEQVLFAQYEQVLALAEQQKIALEQKDPFAQAEQIKAQASLLNTQIKEESTQQKNQLELAKLMQNNEQFNREIAEEQRQFNVELIAQMKELELKFNQNVSIPNGQ
jgi:hypothetical protein